MTTSDKPMVPCEPCAKDPRWPHVRCTHGHYVERTECVDWQEVKQQARRRIARQAGILADVVVNRRTITQSQKDEVVALLRACEKELIDAS